MVKKKIMSNLFSLPFSLFVHNKTISKRQCNLLTLIVRKKKRFLIWNQESFENVIFISLSICIWRKSCREQQFHVQWSKESLQNCDVTAKKQISEWEKHLKKENEIIITNVSHVFETVSVFLLIKTFLSNIR